MMYNRLVTRERRVRHFKDTLKAWDESRCSGRTTAIILKGIAEAINNPQQWVDLVDHCPDAPAEHLCALAQVALKYANKLNLQFFEAGGTGIRSRHMTTNQLELV